MKEDEASDIKTGEKITFESIEALNAYTGERCNEEPGDDMRLNGDGVRRIPGAEILKGKTIIDYVYNRETHEQALMFDDGTHLIITVGPDAVFDQMGVTKEGCQ